MKRFLVTVVVLLALEAAGALAFRASGWKSVAADEPPSALEAWFFGGVSDRSVEAHAAPIAPIDHADPKLQRLGLQHYAEMCVGCHGAPGLEQSEIARGLNPPAPHLWTDDSQSMSDAQLYWVVKHGIRMSGMPAFGPTHDEQALRGLVSFLRQLPTLTGGRYQALVKAAGLAAPGGEAGEPGSAPDGGTP